MEPEHLNETSRSRVSIVIRCLNEVKHIGRLLDAVADQSLQAHEVIVVDSGSDDGTIDLVQNYDVTLLHIRRQDFSFGRALNIGCSAAQGEYLVFVSAHCYPTHSDWLANLVAPFSDEKVACVYGKQRGTESTSFSEQRVFQRWFPETSDLRQAGPFSNNANCAVRRALWEEEPYDEELTGLEDVAWASLWVRRGWYVSYVADADVIHVHDETTSQTRTRYRREAITFQKVFPSEHFSLWDFFRLSTSNIWADWREARRQGLLTSEWAGIVRFRIAQFLGTYQGHRTRRPVSSEIKQRFYYPEDP